MIRSSVAGLALLALAAASSPALARQLAVRFDRPYPTWHDPITLRVGGESATPCGAGAPALLPPLVDHDAWRIELALREPCALPGAPLRGESFELRLELGRLVNGVWTVRLYDERERQLHVETLVVYDVGQLDIDLPALVLAGEPVPIRVRGLAECAVAHASVGAAVSPGLIELTALGPCFPITNPPGGYFSRDLALPPLLPGDYVVRGITEATYSGPAVQETRLRVWDPHLCVPSAEVLCLQSGRFRVTATWTDYDGGEGTAQSAPLDGDDTTGLLWFFAPDNLELTVKMLDGCGLNGHWWAFVAAASTVRWEVEVADMVTGKRRRFGNALGELPRTVADTTALPCRSAA